MEGNVVSVERVIAAPAPDLFRIVADAGRHPEIDGSGTVVKPKPGAPQQLALGTTFGMSMKAGVPYSMSNTVIEFDENRLIAWKTVVSGFMGRFIGGRIWRYEFEPVEDGTLVRESWDISQDRQGMVLRRTKLPSMTAESMTKTLASLAQLVESPGGRVTDGRALIDAAWEERVLPALAEYTRIKCVSPAFDPDWADRGAIVEAAALLAEWAREQDASLQTEIVQLPGRTPVLLVENGGSGDPILIYGHMDKQPPLGDWRPGLAPFEPVRQGDLLYGRGTADDGYSLFAAVTALLAADGGRGRVVILIEASEESGSPDLSAYVDHLRDRIGTPSLVICLDSGCLSYDRLWLTSSLRGNLVATVRVDVLTEGVHSGVGGGVVPSSFRILRRILSRIEDEATGEILLPELLGHGVPDDLRASLSSAAQEFADSALPTVDGLRLIGENAADRLIARAWSAALEVTGMDGVPPVREGGNVLRPFTSAKISLRLPPDVDAQVAADALISAITTDEGAHITIDLEGVADGWLAPPLDERNTGALDRISQATFGHPVGFHGEGGTIPFLADLKRSFPHTQFVATGVLGPHSNAHGPNEFLHIPMAKAVTQAVAELLR